MKSARRMKNTMTAAAACCPIVEGAQDPEGHQSVGGHRAVAERADHVPEDRIATGEHGRDGKPGRDALDERVDDAEPFCRQPDQGQHGDDRHESPAEGIRERPATRDLA